MNGEPKNVTPGRQPTRAEYDALQADFETARALLLERGVEVIEHPALPAEKKPWTLVSAALAIVFGLGLLAVVAAAATAGWRLARF